MTWLGVRPSMAEKLISMAIAYDFDGTLGLLLVAWLAGRQSGWKRGYDAGQKNIKANNHVFPHHHYETN